MNVSPLGPITIFTVTGSNGICSDISTATLALEITPNPILVATPSIICRGNSSTLTASGANTYTWYPSVTIGSSVVVSPTTTTQYTLIAKNSTNCPVSKTIQVVVNPLPTVNISPSSQTVCPGPVTLSATGGNSYTWQPGGSSGSALIAFLNATTVFTVTGTSNNCSSTATAIVVVSPGPTIGISVSNPTICAGGSSTLTANGAVNYTWFPGGSTLNPLVVTPSVSTLYMVVGASSAACTGTAQATVLVQSKPPVNITVFPSATVCTNTSFTLSGNGASTYTWLPSNATGPSKPETIPTQGITVYTVIGSASGCTASATRSITAITTPTVFAIASQTQICSGQSVSLTAGGATSYVWQTPNVIASTNIIVTPTVTSVYTVTGYNNGCSDTFTILVVVKPLPVLTVVSSANPNCSGQSVTLTANGATTYTWLPGGITGNILIVTPTISTLFTVFGTNSVGCTTSLNYAQIVNPNPQINIVASSTNICTGGSATITGVGGSSNGSYTLQPGNMIGNNFVVSPLSTTHYTMTSHVGPCLSRNTITINVLPAVNLVLNANPGSICAGAQSTLTASGAASYTWLPNASIGPVKVVSPFVTTVYTVHATNPGGCKAQGTVAVNVVTNPTLSISASSNSVCAGESVTLSASGAASFIWQPGGMNSSIIVVSPNVSTTYTVFGSTGSCNSTPGVINITVGQYPLLTVQVSKNNICAGQAVSLSASGATNYTWQPGSAAGSALTVNPLTTTTYTLYGDNSGCVSQVPVTITVNPSPDFTVTAEPQIICVGNSALIKARGAGSYTLLPLLITKDSNFVVSPPISTTYTVLSGNSGECVSERTVQIDVIAPPTLSMSGPDVICSGQSLTVTATGPGVFNWMPGNLTGNTVVLSPTVTTQYQVVQTGGAGCNFNSTFTITVISCNGPVFGLTNAASTPVLQHGNYYLINFTVVAVNNSPVNLNKVRLYTDLASTFPSPCTYTVLNAPRILSHNSALVADNSFDGRTNLNITSVSASTMAPNKRDTIQLSVLVAPNGFYGPVENSVLGTAESAAGFSFADSSNNGFLWDPDKDGDPTNNNDVTVIEIKKIELFIPEGFSPNGDGKYDEFVIKGMQGRKAKLLIFNRWGSKVYEDEGTDLRWDGKAHFGLVVGNELVPPSTYYYILQYSDGQKESMNGFVEVKY